MTATFPSASDPTCSDTASAAPYAVALHRVGKAFNHTPALTDLDVCAPLGHITVLLGPNGAGKTTAIRVVTGAMDADRGTVLTLGCDPAVDGEWVRRRCGVVSAKPALYDRLSGTDNLRYAAELHGVPAADQDRRIVEAAGRFGIAHALDLQVGGYSTGMKTRLTLARSVLHRPELLLFDEPTSGLDPESAQAVLQMIREMTDDGHTVVMCTHHLVEAEGLADHVVVLDSGTDLVSGRPEDLVAQYWPDNTITIELDNDIDPSVARAVPGVVKVEHESRKLEITVTDFAIVPDLVSGLCASGARIARAQPHEPTLEDLYFAVRRSAGDTNRIDLAEEVMA